MIKKEVSTNFELSNFITDRWSGVAFDPDRDLNPAQLGSLAEAARWAPSCFGDEPWRFIFCQKSRHPEAWQKAFDCLYEGNQGWNRNVPVLALICGDTLFTQNGKPNAYHKYDTGAAAVSLCLQAAHMGIMTHQMAGFDKDKATELFNIPERYAPLAMMAVGYQQPPESIPDELKERELALRSRRSLDDHFFAGAWGQTLI